MRIAMIGQKGIPMGEDGGGVEKHVEEISTRLVKDGHEVLVYVRPWYSPSTGQTFKGVQIIRCPSWRTKNLDTISHTFFASLDVLGRKCDIIHYHGVGPATLAWIPRLFSRAKIVVTFHSQDRFHKKWGWFARAYLRFGEWAAVRFAHKTITVSQALQTYVRGHFHTETVYIPNGVSLLPPPPASVVADFGLDARGYILAVARLVRHKGLHTLVQAYQGLASTKKLVIVGAPSYTKDYQNYLRGLADGNANILFLGYQGGRTLAALFAHAYLYVNPSESEGLSLSILEAMSFGIPVLVSDIPENKEAVNGCGYFFRSQDAADLRQKLMDLMGDAPKMAEMGVCGKQFIQTHFDWQGICQKTEQTYKQLNS